MADTTPAGPSVSMANKGPPKISEDWWGLDHMRVREAVFYFRRDSSEDWQRLGESYIPLGPKKLPWNVEQISISGKGIEVCQMGSQYKKDKGQPGGGQNEDEYAWRVSFPLGDVEDIWVSEGERQGRALPGITIRFRIIAAPESSDASKLLEGKPSGESVVGEQNENPQSEIAADPATAAQEQSLDDNILVDDEQPRDTTTFPLAQLFRDSSSAGLEIRLDFQRAGAGKGPYRWIWPAVIRFLGHHDKWTCFTKAKDFSQTYGEPFYLDAWLEENKGKSGAKVSSMTTPEGRKEWSISPRPQPEAPGNSSNEMPTESSSVVEPGKRKRDEEYDGEGEEDELAVLDARIESLRSARIIRRDEWNRLREEADAALGRYLELQDELEALEDRRREQLRVTS